MQEKLKNLSLRMILSITDTKTELKLHTLLDEAGIPMRFQFRGLGTASSEVLQVCGLGESDRLLTFWVLPKNMVHRLFAKMNEALCLKKRGRGIAVSIPLRGVQVNMARFIIEQKNSLIDEIKQEENIMSGETAYSMIIATVNQGYSDEVVDTARAAGARGGTVIKGRRCGLDAPMQFWGISLQEEQEALAIIVPKDKKYDIMSAISKKYGFNSPAQGIVLSLPIEDTLGLEE